MNTKMEVFIARNIFVGKITHTEEDAFKNTLHISIDIARDYLTDYNALYDLLIHTEGILLLAHVRTASPEELPGELVCVEVDGEEVAVPGAGPEHGCLACHEL